MRNLINGLQAVLIIVVFTLTGIQIAGATWLTPYFMPLMIILTMVLLTTRGGAALTIHPVNDRLLARMYMRGIVC